MIKIGFIDYFLNNYHAKNYPAWIREYSGGDMEVSCAWASAECPNEGGMTNAEWSETYGIPLLDSPEAVIEACDCIMVLSPSHPKEHEALSQAALRSGKRVYVDKAFAPDVEAAKRMFRLAEEFGTPCCSSSSLAFISAYEQIDRDKLQILSSKGAGSFEVYTIHQFEPVVAIMGGQPKRVMSTGAGLHPAFMIEFADGRIAKTEQFSTADFTMYAGYPDGSSDFVVAEPDIFKGFILRVIEYFKTGRLVAEREQTLAVIALLDAAKEALQNPFNWVTLPDYTL